MIFNPFIRTSLALLSQLLTLLFYFPLVILVTMQRTFSLNSLRNSNNMRPLSFNSYISKSSVNPHLISQPKFSSKISLRGSNQFPYSFSSETLFILDGTAAMYHAYFSREGKDSFANAKFSPKFSAELLSSLPENTRQQLQSESLVELEVKNEEVIETSVWNLEKDSILESQSNSLFTSFTELKDTKTVCSTGSTSLLSCTALVVTAMNFARLIRELKPTYFAVAFDAGRKTFRNDLWPAYKQHRPPQPADLTVQMSVAPDLFTAFGCKCLTLPGFEADDIMASLGNWARQRGLQVVHISSDKDMLQLIETGVTVLNPRTKEIIGDDEVVTKFGVSAAQIVDYLALMGDSADNIPGAVGIGPKTAQKLIQEFGTVKAIYDKLGLDKVTINTAPIDIKSLDGKAAVWKQLESQLSSVEIEYAKAILSKVKAKSPEQIIRSLAYCGADQMELFCELIRLKRDVDWTKGLKVPTISNMEDTKTEFFRFRGEEREKQIQLDKHIEEMSSSLSQPLKLLRQQYHFLDRE